LLFEPPAKELQISLHKSINGVQLNSLRSLSTSRPQWELDPAGLLSNALLTALKAQMLLGKEVVTVRERFTVGLELCTIDRSPAVPECVRLI